MAHVLPPLAHRALSPQVCVHLNSAVLHLSWHKETRHYATHIKHLPHAHSLTRPKSKVNRVKLAHRCLRLYLTSARYLAHNGNYNATVLHEVVRFACTTVNQFTAVHEMFRNCAASFLRCTYSATLQTNVKMQMRCRLFFSSTNVHRVHKFEKSWTADMIGFRGVNAPTLA